MTAETIVLPGAVPILMYHAISEKAARRFLPFAVAPKEFESHIRFLRVERYTTYTVSGYLRALDTGKLAAKPIVLTFDDGFADFFETVMPVLMNNAMTATLYAVSGAVGGTSGWLSSSGEENRPLMNWPQLASIAKSGIEIGAHSVTHPALDLVPLKIARAEIAGSKKTLEDRLGMPVQSFAYPYGYYSRKIRDIVEEEGFSSACAVNYAASSAAEDRFLLSRQIVRRGTTLAGLAAILESRIPLPRLINDRLRSQAWRTLRHTAAWFEHKQAGPWN